MDILGREEKKQMLTRIERMELMNNDTAKTLAAINESLRLMNEKIEGRDWLKVSGEPVPELPKKTFEQAWVESKEDGDVKFEVELGVLKEIRSGIAETNSILASMMRALHNIDVTLAGAVLKPQPPMYPTQTPPITTDPPYKFTCDISKDANPYPMHDDAMTDISKLEPKPFNDEENKESE